MKLLPSLVVASLLPGAALLSAPPAAAPLPPVVARYEQMLVRTPGRGTAFEKVYQHFFDGEGLEKLAERWSEREANDAAQAGSYRLLRGLLAERQGRNEEALALYTQATEREPGQYGGWVALGDLGVSMGRTGAAVAAYQQALAHGAPAEVRPRVYRQLARSQQRNFDPAGAAETWKQFVREAPDDPFVLEEAGEAMAEGERFGEARELFETLRDRAGTDPYQRVRAILKLAQLEEQQGHPAAARTLYEGALPLAAEGSWMHREVRTRLEELFRRQDDLPGLTQYYQRWLEGHPRDVEAALRLSAALGELNKKGEAVEWLRQAAAWAPERQEVQITLARRLGETGQPEEAVPILARLAQARPEEGSLQELLGEAHWLVWEKKKDEAARTAALECWRRLAPAETKDPAVAGHLGDVLRRHQQADLALAEYRRAVALAPAVSDLRERLVEYLFELSRPEEAWREVGTLAQAPGADPVRVARLQMRHEAEAWALSTVEQARGQQPRQWELLLLQWELLAGSRRWEEAQALFEPMTQAVPNPYFLEEVEGRFLTALGQAGKEEAWRAERAPRLGAGTLEERDLRLLARQALREGRPEEAQKALQEGAARFPDSFSLARLQVEYARRQEDVEGRVRGLRRLMALQPKLRTDFLRETVTAWREGNRWDEALAAVGELIAAAPASAEAQVLGAETLLAADRPEEAIGKLKAAIRLSEQPNNLRLRLSQLFTDLGRPGEARETLDEAFEAAGKPAERLALMPQMTQVYFAEGRLDTLLERFRQRQRGEEEGWRYALYLAEIYKQTLDYGAARRELARALAARPHDGGLLRQMVRLADEEGNHAEQARYQELLTEAEPSEGNQVALLETLLENGQAESALARLRQQLPAVKKQKAWDRLLPGFARAGLLGPVNELLAAEPGVASSWESRLQAAIVQAMAGQVPEAQAALWKIFALPSPPPGPETAPAPAAGMNGRQPTPFELRMSACQQQRDRVEELLNAETRQRFYSAAGTVSGGSTRVAPVETARDTALLFLAGLAVKTREVPAFLTRLEQELQARGSTRLERLFTYSVVEEKERIWQEIRAQAEAAPEPMLDALCLSHLMGAVYRGEAEAATMPPKEELLTLFDKFQDRVPAPAGAGALEGTMARYYFYSALGRKEKMQELRRQVLATLDFSKKESLTIAMPFALAEGDLPLAKKIAAALLDPGQAARAATPALQAMSFLPIMVLQFGRGEKLPVESQIDFLTEVLALWYPATAPARVLNPTSSGFWMGGDELPQTHFLDAQRMTVVAQIAVQFNLMRNMHQEGASQEGLPHLRERLEEQARTLPPEKRIYPRLMLTYFAAWQNDFPKAAAAAQALVADYPEEEDLRLLAGTLLGRNKQPAEALALLGQIHPRFGQSQVDLQKQLLSLAKLAGDSEQARKAALRLAGLRLNTQDRQELAHDLRELGLTEKAEAMEARSGGGSSGAGSGVRPYEQYQKLRTMVEAKQKPEALAEARKILAGDPLRLIETEFVVEEALKALSTFGELDGFLRENTAALAQSPQSLRLLYLQAKGWELVEAPRGRSLVGPVVKLPCWLKLERRGDEVLGSFSPDGAAWTEVGRAVVRLPERMLAGLLLAGKEQAGLAQAEFEEVQLGTGPEAEAPTRQEVGERPAPGTAEQAGGTWKLRAGGGSIGGETEAFSFWPRPVAGAQTLVARLKATEPGEGFGETGLMLREAAEPKSSAVSLLVGPGGKVRLRVRTLGASEAEGYWRRVVAARPEEVKFRKGLAKWLNRKGKTDEAFALYDRMFAQNPETLMSSLQELTGLYRTANRLPELAEKVAAWRPADSSGSDYSWAVSELVKALSPLERPDLVEKVAQRALENTRYSGVEALTNALYGALRAQGKVAAAREVVLSYFSPRKQPEAAAGATLGFRNQARYIDTRPGWCQSLRGGSDGVELQFTEVLDLPGVEALGPEITARVEGTPKEVVSEETRKAMLACLKVRAGAPGALAEVRACLALPEEQMVSALLYECGRELKFQPGQRTAALALLRDLRPRLETDSFLRYSKVGALLEIARLEEALGEAALPETLRSIARTLEEDSVMKGSSNRRSFDWGQAQSCLKWLLRAGMEKEYLDFLAKMKKTREGAKMDWTYDEERRHLEGDAPKTQVMLWPERAEGGGSGAFRFELRREHPYDHGETFKYLASRGRSLPALEKERTLRFYHSRTRQEWQLLGELTTAKAAGRWEGELPPGGGWMRVAEVQKEAEGGEQEVPGPAVPVSAAPNLVQNAGFQGLTAQGAELTPKLAGWEGFGAGCWTVRPTGPQAGGAVQAELSRSEQECLLIGAAIPLVEGRSYLQSAWLRPALGEASLQAGRRYLAADGKELKATWFPEFSALNWQWVGQRLVRTKEPEGDLIPPGAVAVQPLLKVKGGGEWTGLYLGEN